MSLIFITKMESVYYAVRTEYLVVIHVFEPLQDYFKYLFPHNIGLYDVAIFSPRPTPGWKIPLVGRRRMFSCTVAASTYNSGS
jgi:hypothetical protein